MPNDPLPPAAPTDDTTILDAASTPGSSGSAGGRWSRRTIALVVALTVTALGGIAWGAAATSTQRSAEKARDNAQEKIADLEEELNAAQEKIADLSADLEDATSDAAAAKKKAAQAQKAATAAAQEDAAAAQDDEELIALTRERVPADVQECGVITVVGYDGSDTYAITHADLESQCTTTKVDPAEFMWMRSGDTWTSVDTKSVYDFDPSIDALVICEATSHASAEIQAAIAEIC